MSLKNTLEKIVSPIRLGWHGVLLNSATAAGMAAGTYFTDASLIDTLPPFLCGMTLGTMFYRDSLHAFKSTNKNINKYGMDERFIEPHKVAYCNRQGARTAAANHGMAQDFDSIMEKYRQDMQLKWLPHV